MSSLNSVYFILSYNIYRANMFSIPWKSVVLLCKFESASNILSLNFESGEVSESFFFFYMKIFASSLPLGHLHHLSLSFSSFMLINSPSLISSGWIFRVSCKVTVNILLFSYSSSSPILDLNFTFSVITFYFFLFVCKSFS